MMIIMKMVFHLFNRIFSSCFFLCNANKQLQAVLVLYTALYAQANEMGRARSRKKKEKGEEENQNNVSKDKNISYSPVNGFFLFRSLGDGTNTFA